MPSCQFCHRHFKNPQAIKAHLRHCEAYQSVPKAEAVPKAADASFGREQYGGTDSMTKQIHSDDVEVLLPRQRPGRDSQESLMTLLDVHEALVALVREGVEHYGYVHMVENMRPSDEPGCIEWKGLLLDLHQCIQDTEHMKANFRLNHSMLYAMYDRMLTVKERWVDYRRYDVEGCHRPIDMGAQGYFDESNPILQEEERSLDILLSRIKKMVVSSR